MKARLLITYLIIFLIFPLRALASNLNDVVDMAIKSGVPQEQVYLVINKAKAFGIEDKSINEMLQILIKAKEHDILVSKISNKILEGISKNVKPEMIINTCDKLEQAYEQANRIYNKISISGHKTGELKDAMAMAIFNGVSPNELKSLYLSAPGATESYYLIGTVSLTSLIASGMEEDKSYTLIKKAFIEHKSAGEIQNETETIIRQKNYNGLMMRHVPNELNEHDMNRMNSPNNPANRIQIEHLQDMRNQRN